MLDGIYNIKANNDYTSLLLITQINITFNNGKCIGHIEQSLDHVPQTAINSLTTQKVIDVHIQPDSFTHTLPGDVRKTLNQLLETFKSLLDA